MLNIMWVGWSPLIASLPAGLLVVYYWVWSRSRFIRLINTVPGPDCFPILVNILSLNVPSGGYWNVRLTLLAEVFGLLQRQAAWGAAVWRCPTLMKAGGYRGSFEVWRYPNWSNVKLQQRQSYYPRQKCFNPAVREYLFYVIVNCLTNYFYFIWYG
jgi:hypothetical protein